VRVPRAGQRAVLRALSDLDREICRLAVAVVVFLPVGLLFVLHGLLVPVVLQPHLLLLVLKLFKVEYGRGGEMVAVQVFGQLARQCFYLLLGNRISRRSFCTFLPWQ
jgi:hypothetical protein